MGAFFAFLGAGIALDLIFNGGEGVSSIVRAIRGKR